MEIESKIKINSQTGEVEITGSENFVREHVSLLERVLKLPGESHAGAASVSAPAAPAPTPAPASIPTQEPEAAAVAPKPAATKAPVPVTSKPGQRKRGRPRKTAAPAPSTSTGGGVSVSSGAQTFSQFISSFTKKMKKGDYILAAGYYFQNSNKSKEFTTFNTSKLLKSQGIKLANPSQYVKNNVQSGRIEQTGKRSYRVTNQGVAYLNSLIKG